MIPQERQNPKNAFFLKNAFFFGLSGFAKNRLMFLKVYINFSIYSEGGAIFKKMGMMFYFGLFNFPEIFMHF